jgi:putative membrane-bound dehydrogenase-like protein
MNFLRTFSMGILLIAWQLSPSLFCAEPENSHPGPSEANRLTYLDENDPFYVGVNFPKLTTPQWIGEPGVDAVVILAVDDMTETARYETFLRPILERLKRIDGRAPVSIMTRSIPVADMQAQKWLKEGLSLEVHTLKHPCPLLANGDFQFAAATYYDCLDLLTQILGNKPVAFRMPCCDSMDSPSPRFYAEIFNYLSPKGNFLTIDSSVMNLFTTNDSALPRELVVDNNGAERFRKYFPAKTNSTTRVNLEAFATTVENYPYPYVFGKLCWEFPCSVPSDWEAFNLRGATNAVTVADWQADLDATVLKQGVFSMIFHPHGWIRNDQLVQLIDYANAKYGKRIKFLTFREAQERLNQNLLHGEPLRAANGHDNGVRLIDLNHDGFLDVVIGNSRLRTTRIWNPASRTWTETEFPTALVATVSEKESRDAGVRFGCFGASGQVTAFRRDESSKGAWSFNGSGWVEISNFFSGLSIRGEPMRTVVGGRDRGVRMRDVDHDGRAEVLVANESQSALFSWADDERTWKRLPFSLPTGLSIVTETGTDNGLRFIDVNGDGYDDVLFSNEKGYSLYLFISQPKPWLGWDVGWTYRLRSGKRGQPREIPMVVRGGEHPNNGAWVHGTQLFVQNEDTSTLPDKVQRVSFDELQLGDEATPKSPTQAIGSFRLAPGLKIETVASEPQIVDPVAFDWGPDGRLWVVEMRDYPLGMDGKGKPGGVVCILEDTHGNGHYDKSTVFLEGLRFPNGIMPWGKGVLISAAPDILYAEDTDGDGKADVTKVLFTGFREGNQQHRINGFEYGLDNWVYAANGGSGGVVRSVAKGFDFDMRGHDLRILPDDGSMELQPGPTQFGRHRDDWGNWFGNDNSRWLWHYFLPDHYLARNPYLSVSSTMRQLPSSPDPGRIFAVSQPQQRFNWPTHLFEVTSACSATPYRDEVLGPEFASSVFICEPANNVVHREVLELDGVSFRSHRALSETNSEFLSSTDNWFRPVMIKTGPDGALYLADMYRLIIEHPEYFPEELKHRPDMRAGEDKGRIYRISPAGVTLRKVPRLDRLSTEELVSALDSPNGWQRDTAQRLLVQSHDSAAISNLEKLVKGSPNAKARLQALCTLDGFHAISSQVLETALQDSQPEVRRQAVRLSESRFVESPGLNSRLLALATDPDIRVRYQLAFSLGEWRGTNAGVALALIALKDWSDEAMQIAVLSSAPNHLEQLVPAVMAQAKARSVPASLVERVVALATEMSQDDLLGNALADVVKPVNSGYASWQLAASIGFLDGLDRRKISVADFSRQASGDLQRVLPHLDALFAQARQLAASPGATDEDRWLAVRLLGRGPSSSEQDIPVLAQLLGPKNPEPVQKAAMAGLRRCTSDRVPAVLLKAWRTCGLAERQEILNTIFSRTSWVEALVVALEQGSLSPAELGTLPQQKLLGYSVAEVRDRAARLFSAINSDRQKVVARYKGVSELSGDSNRGKTLFVQNCSICHKLQGEGHSIGPDLGTVADKPVQELVLAILDPNQAVDPIYTAYTVTLKDDREFTGILASETPNSITLRLPGGAEEVIQRSDVQEVRGSGRSLMPEGFETGLKPQDLADLIAYIQRSAVISAR